MNAPLASPRPARSESRSRTDSGSLATGSVSRARLLTALGLGLWSMVATAPNARAFSFPIGVSNVCFADRVGDKITPAWNTPFTGEIATPPEADPESSGPVEVWLPEAVIGDDYFAWLDVYVFGLSLGQSVVLERFLVDNDEGVIDENAVLMESHRMQEGYLPRVGDIPNLSSVEDWDGFLDGEIFTQLGMFGGLANMPGEYVIRVSSPLGSFPAATARLTIEEVPTDQFFHGRVVAGGAPVPGAFVALLQPQGFTSEILFAARADGDGDYLLYAPGADEVDVVAAAPGFVGPFQQGASRVIDDGEELEHDIELIPGTVTIAGRVRRADTDEPIPGLPVTFLTVDGNNIVDGRLMAHTWTDAGGEFSVSVTPDRWNVVIKTYEASSRNLLTPVNEPLWIVDTTNEEDLTGLVFDFVRADCVIAGVLSDEYDEPLEQIQVSALNVETGQASSGYTLGDGYFTLPAAPGLWKISPSSFELEVAGRPGVKEIWVRLTESNQSTFVYPVALEINAELDGYFRRESDNSPVGDLLLWAQSVQDEELVSVFQSTYGSDGYYNIYLPAGDWFVLPSPRQASARQLLMRNLPRVTVEHDDYFVEPIELDVAVVEPERTVKVTLLDTQGNPVPNIPIHAHMEDEQADNYDAFGYTDAAGVAMIPAKAGHWHFHASSYNLRNAGMRAIPEVHAMVGATCGAEPELCQCGSVQIQLTTEPFTQELPEITSVEIDETNSLVIRGTGEPGKLYEVQGSFDLKNWTFAGRTIALGGTFTITDPWHVEREEEQTGEPGGRIFYRLVNQP